jgi:hypothetical protein
VSPTARRGAVIVALTVAYNAGYVAGVRAGWNYHAQTARAKWKRALDD